MIGAQKARTEVKNQCRTKTTSSVFFVSVHVCEKKPAMVTAGPAMGYCEVEVVLDVFKCQQIAAIAPGIWNSY
jgi:hypothetical protein